MKETSIGNQCSPHFAFLKSPNGLGSLSQYNSNMQSQAKQIEIKKVVSDPSEHF